MTTSRLPLEELRVRRGFVANNAYSGGTAAAPHGSASTGENALEEAFRKGYAEGQEAAFAEAEAQRVQEDAAREKLELAFARFDAESAKLLRERLHATVLALCEETIAPLALDPEGLSRRVEAAAALLQRKTDERTIRLHPDDLKLIRDQVNPTLTLVADPGIERGALRIDTDDGGVEDGPQQWRLAIEEALGSC